MRRAPAVGVLGLAACLLFGGFTVSAAMWTVDPAADVGDFCTIWEAILFAAPGGTIRINPGTYEEHVELISPVMLVGSSDGEAKVEGLVVRESACGAVIKNLTIAGSGAMVRGVDLNSVRDVRLEKLTVSGCVDGIWIGDSSHVVVRECVVQSNSTGIHLRGSSDCEIDANTASRNVEGITLDSGSAANIVDGNRAEGNSIGITVGESSRNHIRGNSLALNAYGINSWEAASNTFSGNVATGNSTGINLYECTGATVEGNVCAENREYGILLNYCAECAARGNTANANRRDGIRFNDSEACEATSNSCEANWYAGVYLWNASGCRVVANRLIENDYAGLVLAGSSWGTEMEDNVLKANGYLNLADWTD